MQINNNNNNVNFQARMFLSGKTLKNSTRWQKIAEKFEEKTAKRFPEYKMELFQDNRFFSTDRLSISIDRGSSDDLCLREHILTPAATDNLMKLSDNKIIQKLTKLLNIVKKRDKMMDQLPDDIAKLEKKYKIELNQREYESMVEPIQESVLRENYVKIQEDPILSDYTESSNIFI